MLSESDKPTTKEADIPPAKHPFSPRIQGKLRRRLFKYARERGRSAAGAVRWLLQQQLTREGF